MDDIEEKSPCNPCDDQDSDATHRYLDIVDFDLQRVSAMTVCEQLRAKRTEIWYRCPLVNCW